MTKLEEIDARAAHAAAHAKRELLIEMIGELAERFNVPVPMRALLPQLLRKEIGVDDIDETLKGLTDYFFWAGEACDAIRTGQPVLKIAAQS